MLTSVLQGRALRFALVYASGTADDASWESAIPCGSHGPEATAS